MHNVHHLFSLNPGHEFAYHTHTLRFCWILSSVSSFISKLLQCCNPAPGAMSNFPAILTFGRGYSHAYTSSTCVCFPALSFGCWEWVYVDQQSERKKVWDDLQKVFPPRDILFFSSLNADATTSIVDCSETDKLRSKAM